jgi:hypothetical protein
MHYSATNSKNNSNDPSLNGSLNGSLRQSVDDDIFDKVEAYIRVTLSRIFSILGADWDETPINPLDLFGAVSRDTNPLPPWYAPPPLLSSLKMCCVVRNIYANFKLC